MTAHTEGWLYEPPERVGQRYRQCRSPFAARKPDVPVKLPPERRRPDGFEAVGQAAVVRWGHARATSPHDEAIPGPRTLHANLPQRFLGRWCTFCTTCGAR